MSTKLKLNRTRCRYEHCLLISCELVSVCNIYNSFSKNIIKANQRQLNGNCNQHNCKKMFYENMKQRWYLAMFKQKKQTLNCKAF